MSSDFRVDWVTRLKISGLIGSHVKIAVVHSHQILTAAGLISAHVAPKTGKISHSIQPLKNSWRACNLLIFLLTFKRLTLPAPLAAQAMAGGAGHPFPFQEENGVPSRLGSAVAAMRPARPQGGDSKPPCASPRKPLGQGKASRHRAPIGPQRPPVNPSTGR